MFTNLPEIYRTVLELRTYHDLSEKQIATALGISYAAVRKRLERARNLLAVALGRRNSGCHQRIPTAEIVAEVVAFLQEQGVPIQR